MVAVARQDVSVDAIVAGRYLTAREPFPSRVADAAADRLLAPTKCRLWFLVPVQMVSLASPKVLWLLQAALQDLVLYMRRGHCRI